MRVANRNTQIELYTTWYEFRRDLGKRLGHVPLNHLWLEVKPKEPLPWNDSHMHTCLSTLARIKGRKPNKNGQGGNKKYWEEN